MTVVKLASIIIAANKNNVRLIHLPSRTNVKDIRVYKIQIVPIMTALRSNSVYLAFVLFCPIVGRTKSIIK